MADDGEQVDAWLLPGLQRLRRWQCGHTAGYGSRHVTLGRMVDGRWLVEDSDIRVGSRAYRSRERAERQLTELMWDGEWTEVPAVLDGTGRPVDRGWIRRGNTWMREPSDDASDR